LQIKLNWILQSARSTSCEHSMHTPLRPGPNSTRVNLQSQQVSSTHHLPPREPHSPVQLIGRLHHPPPTKLNVTDGEHNSPLPGKSGTELGTDL
jgi:hypothetical protein